MDWLRDLFGESDEEKALKLAAKQIEHLMKALKDCQNELEARQRQAEELLDRLQAEQERQRAIERGVRSPVDERGDDKIVRRPP